MLFLKLVLSTLDYPYLLKLYVNQIFFLISHPPAKFPKNLSEKSDQHHYLI